MDNFSMMYRSTPHSTIGVSPAELYFKRRIRTKLPHLQEFGIEDEVQDRDSERKAKGKMYAECQRNARESEIREDTSKSTDASEAQRATQSLSNQESRETVNVSSERASEDGPLEYTRSDDATIGQRDSVTLRPTRVKRLPSKFQGYVLGFIQLDSEQNFETLRIGTLN
ncbi:unnamed protein product [Porites lobata]|uniref:Uncharacterized protein n=1 Tax=Porites lobata TaxID=104759 RepID=A0ABN8QMW1_9CNID|nr:unnamed protein product [Porites lobata]